VDVHVHVPHRRPDEEERILDVCVLPAWKHRSVRGVPRRDVRALVEPIADRGATQGCHLQEPNRDALVLYARFIGDSVDYVLNQLIETTLVKDRDFLI
jgi:hypothetical protein